MDVFFKLQKMYNLSLALGFFDGIHIVHRVVINNAIALAKRNNTKSAVITFREHPKSILTNSNIKLLTDNNMKINILSNLSVDYFFLLDFNELRYMSAIDYLELLVEYFSPIAITTGFNYGFGYKRLGNTELLSQMSNKYNYNYFEIGAIKYNNNVISSTLIRQLIYEKRYEEAKLLLGNNLYDIR